MIYASSGLGFKQTEDKEPFLFYPDPQKVCDLYGYTETFINAYIRQPHWRGHQTYQTVVSLKGRLPQKLQSKSTLSCEIVQI